MPKQKSENLLKSANENANLNGVTPPQERALTALLEASSIAEAALQADVGESTLRRWLREDQNFQAKLRRLRDQTLSHASLRLQQGASDAVESMHKLLSSSDRIQPGRVSLVRTALDFAFRSGAYHDLADRLAALEKAAGPEEQ